MAKQGDLLLGHIALREGLITREQLYDCLAAQERNPSKTLGTLLVSRGYLKTEDVDRLLDLQKDAFESIQEGAPDLPPGALLGRILIDKGLATEYQVNECLRLQGRLADLGIRPLPQLGEILLKRGYVKKDALETALHLQTLPLYACPECGTSIRVEEEPPGRDSHLCAKCGAEVPFLFAKMAAAVHDALEAASREHDQDLPEEVRIAKLDPANHFGKYVLLKEIGRGGAGIVYRAWQRDFNKFVALKLLPHESDTAAGIRTPYGDAEDIKRFYNEIRAAAELSHRNIVPILDFGVVDNHFFYTMRYVEGVTLDGVVRDGIDEKCFEATELAPGERYAPSGEPGRFKARQLPSRLAAAILRDIGRALDYAHERGVFHRDLKPSNVIIDRKGRPWVMDFGLAKVAHIGDSAYVKGVIMGTPYYMPPEQAVGDMEHVDNLSDIYSLGAILYELVSGYCPYVGKTPDEVLSLLPQSPPEPVEQVAPHVPADLQHIIRKAMRPEKRLRYRRAALMAEDLQRFLNGKALQDEPDGARPTPLWSRLLRLITGEKPPAS